MSFFEALFFLYLLFPVINEKQFLISNAMKGNITLEKTEELKTKLEKFLNSDEIDFGLYEEPKKNHSEFYLKNSFGKLVFFKFDKELLSVSNELENFSCTSVNEEQFSMVKYNADYKPVEKIVWENKNTVADSKIILKENWKYSGEYIFSTKEDLEAAKAKACSLPPVPITRIFMFLSPLSYNKQGLSEEFTFIQHISSQILCCSEHKKKSCLQASPPQ